jgi:L-threonylcarbamoyladenylate synthase
MSEITKNIDLVISELKKGHAVAIPTETVYGLAALASQETAVQQVYVLKHRPIHHPLIVHVHPDFDLSDWVEHLSDEAKQLMKAFWPGPLTLVFKRRTGRVLDCITGGQDTVAVRCPVHPMTQTILAKLGEPLVAPSANPFGKVSPTTAQHVQESFPDTPLLILDGGRCALGIESTIVSVVDVGACQVLRPGAIDETAIYEKVGYRPAQAGAIRVSGQLKQHYQPHKPVLAFDNISSLLKTYEQQRVTSMYVMAFHDNEQFERDLFFHFSQEVEQVAFELFYQLRLADASSVSAILIELPPDEPKWAAIRDRIKKAAG